MNYFQAEQISKAYGEKVLFEDISLSISQGDKVGLIARNGTGKTTLMNIIAGKDQPDDGQLSYRTSLRIAYLEQQPFFEPDHTLSQALLHDDNELTRTIREYEELVNQPVEGKDPGQQKRLQQIMERMDALQAWDYETRMKQILSQLMIPDLSMKVKELSGGQIKRLALAQILIDEADLILLDEPTNHLDVGMIEWLENYLVRKKMTLLLVTHDRYFLDAVCNEIVELEDGNIYQYKGNYSYFLEKKQER
ncbi:MAG: ATP-binding cassette domain-containing protein, partial [Bacteroidales bacterium]